MGPVAEVALQQQLQALLGNLPFRLIAGDKLTQDRLTPNNLLGLYGCSAIKGAYAVGVLDANAVCMVGGGVHIEGVQHIRESAQACLHAIQPQIAPTDHTGCHLREGWRALQHGEE